MVPLVMISVDLLRLLIKGIDKMTLGWMQRTDSAATSFGLRNHVSKAALIACPLLFTGFIGIYSRSYTDDHVVPAGTPAQDAVAFSYVPYVRETNEILSHARYSRGGMLKLAYQWDDAVRSGRLQPLVPISFEDDPKQGARNEIFRAKCRVVARLLDDVIDQSSARNYHQAVVEAVLAARLSESLKYSSFNSVYTCSTEQKRALSLVAKIAHKLSADDKVLLRDSLATLQSNAAELGTLTRFSRTQYYDYLGRMSKQPVSIEDVHRTVLLTKRIASDPTSRDTLNLANSSVISSSSDDSPEYLSEMRVACAAEQTNQSAIKNFLAKL